MLLDIRKDSIFKSEPVDAYKEMCAYESLWLNEGAWFKSLSELFHENDSSLPSELVSEEYIVKANKRLVDEVGRDVLRKVKIRVHGAGEYPKKIRDADHPVELLYYLGDWELVETSCVAIVGARAASDEGKFNAARIASSLAKKNYTIVSGLAKGIDRAALDAAIKVGGKTIGVIGTPLDKFYPKENIDLQSYMAERHLVISQVPFLRYRDQSVKTNRFFFPARNVTMSALTKATIIVEASNTSGTLIQARAALAQGRKLFILESCFRNPDLKWPRKYESRGAFRVKNVNEIIRELERD